jgi:sulfite reductase (NADPH) hemoprotein beta-component
VIVGGGLGRTPMVGKTIRGFLPADELLPYVTAIMRVYNRFGRRDNKYKARIKILVHEIGVDAMSELVEAEYAKGDHEDAIELAPPRSPASRPISPRRPTRRCRTRTRRITWRTSSRDKAFARWVQGTTPPQHKVPGYAIANISLKPTGGIPGDATAEQMRIVADLAERHSFGEIRVAHEQNLVLPDVPIRDLHALWQGSMPRASPRPTSTSSPTSSPAPAWTTAASRPPARSRWHRRSAAASPTSSTQEDVGDLHINISGCINACGHHHVAHLGILGLEKKGVESYQITLGGSADENAAIGQLLGPGFAADEIVDAVEAVVRVYLDGRRGQDERFLDFFRRVGVKHFKEAIYATV